MIYDEIWLYHDKIFYSVASWDIIVSIVPQKLCLEDYWGQQFHLEIPTWSLNEVMHNFKWSLNGQS